MKSKMNALAIVLAVGAAFFVFYVYNNKNTKATDNKPFRPPGGGLPPQRTDNKIESVIENYFNKLEKDIEQYELGTFYSYQLDLDNYKNASATRQEKFISNLSALDLDSEQAEDGKLILMKKAQLLTKGKQMDWSNSLIFLLDYSSIEGKISALNSIKNEATDKAKVETYLNKLNKSKNDLIASYFS